ncbi:MAG: hypothetical protein ACREE4_04190 [Stellaceae bacterium]
MKRSRQPDADPVRKARFREAARAIVARDRDDCKHGFAVDTAGAIAATFARRRTMIPMVAPDALMPEFGGDPGKQRQGAAFAADLEGVPRELQTAVADLAAFLMPAAAAARGLS